MATPRRRRRSVAEIEALANKPTKAKRPPPKGRALEKPRAVPKAVRAKAAQRSLGAAIKEIKELAATKRRAALVGSGARTYPQAKSPAPKPNKTVAEIERRANKPTPSKAKVAMKRNLARAQRAFKHASRTERFPDLRRRETAIERKAEKRQHTPEMRHIVAASKTGGLRRLEAERAKRQGILGDIASPRRPQPTQVAPPPDLGVFGRTVPKRGVPRRRR